MGLERARHPVTCARCGLSVEVSKNSLAHTLVQWVSVTDQCAVLSASTERARIPTCQFLRSSIDDSVRAGAVPVPDYLPES